MIILESFADCFTGRSPELRTRMAQICLLAKAAIIGVL